MRYRERRPAVSSVVGSLFFVLIMILAIGALASIFNSFTTYTNTVNEVGNSRVQAENTQLSVSGSSFGAFPPSTTSDFNVATACSTTSTSPTNQDKLFFAAGMWWDFFTCNSNFQYSTSFDGVTWGPETTIPGLVSGYTVGSYFDIQVVDGTIYLVVAKLSSARFQLGIGSLAAGGTYAAPAGTITWTSAPAEVTTTANALGPIQIAVDDAGNQWVAVVQGATAIAIYEHDACATASNTGWRPNACGSSAAPTNYAPTSSPNLGALSANANMILFSPPSTLASTGTILLYETGSSVVPSTGTVAVITQTALASSSWNQITLLGITAYSLTSSSALFIGNTMYFAGLQNAAAGQTTGNLKFWTLAFTSMTAGTNTAEQTIESSTLAWRAALTSSGTTLALFDNPSSTTIQYYTSSTLGSIWSSPAITLESAETAINGLSPASGAVAVTWANATPNVRFAALSTVDVTNSSPWGVHVVDLYIYNPATNSLVAHYYTNSTNYFDYWIGQGSTTTIPVRFIWTATTSYLVTIGTDTGVTSQLIANSPPVSPVACPSGSFFSQLSPTTVCGAPATPGTSTVPYLISGGSDSTCTDTTSGTARMMGLGLSYTTRASSSGNIYVSFGFQVTSPATSNVNSVWQLVYGTGTAPSCNNAATGTTLGQAYTVRSQAAVTRGLSQSVSVTLSGLIADTRYWFDVQATDSSTAAWVYSNPQLAITDVLSTSSPLLTTSTNTNTCTDTSTATRMMGFATTFTTGGAGFTGNVLGKLTFNIAGPATSSINTRFTIAYGTGAAPACNAAAAGTTEGNQYTVGSQAAVVGGASQSAGLVLTGLSPSTTYWVDVQVVDSSTAAWVYSNPTLAVMETPTATNSLPYVSSSENTNTCTVNVANTYRMGGFGVKYIIPSSAKGDLYITLTFQISIPGTSSIQTQWQAAYDTGAPPACNTQGIGRTVANTYTVRSQSGTAGAISQSETFVIQDVEHVAGATIWVDIQAFDSTTASWVFSNPQITAAALPA